MTVGRNLERPWVLLLFSALVSGSLLVGQACAVKRLTTRFGANLAGTSGSVLIISPNAPPGPLDSKFLQPYAGFDVGFTKNWTGKAYWAYHGYHEDADSAVPQDFFAPRNFHANLVTLSLRYAF